MGKILNSKDVKLCCVCDFANGEFSVLYRHSSFDLEMLLKINNVVCVDIVLLFPLCSMAGGMCSAPVTLQKWRY